MPCAPGCGGAACSDCPGRPPQLGQSVPQDCLLTVACLLTAASWGSSGESESPTVPPVGVLCFEAICRKTAYRLDSLATILCKE